MAKRSLSLRRDVLRELSTEELRDVAGGTTGSGFSALDYISCYPAQCLPTFDTCCTE